MTPHPYKLRPYHNPENVDESKVPAGWRFRYEDEMGKWAKAPCGRWSLYPREFSISNYCCGIEPSKTYIVPVNQ